MAYNGSMWKQRLSEWKQKTRTLGEKANKQQNNLIKEQQDRKKNGFYDSDRTLFIRTSHAHFIHAIRQRTQTINLDTASHRIHLVWCSTRFAVNVSEHPHFPFTYDLNARRVTMRLMRRRGHIFFSFPPFHTLVLCLQTNEAGWITPEIHTRIHSHQLSLSTFTRGESPKFISFRSFTPQQRRGLLYSSFALNFIIWVLQFSDTKNWCVCVLCTL